MKNKKFKTATAAIIKKVAGKMADYSCGMASCWGLCQPKEPKMLKK